MRTAFSELAFGLLIIRLFNREFLPIGTVFTAHAILMVSLSLYERKETDFILHSDSEPFETNGYNVLAACGLTLSAQIALLALLAQL